MLGVYLAQTLLSYAILMRRHYAFFSDLKSTNVQAMLITHSLKEEFDEFKRDIIVAVSTQDRSLIEQNGPRIEHIKNNLKNLTPLVIGTNIPQELSDLIDKLYISSLEFVDALSPSELANPRISLLADRSLKQRQEIGHLLEKMVLLADQKFSTDIDSYEYFFRAFILFCLSLIWLVLLVVLAFVARLPKIARSARSLAAEMTKPQVQIAGAHLAGNTEITELARSANHMLETFHAQTARLQASIAGLELEKQQLMVQLQQTAKLASLGTLGAGVAHELNNPLTGIKGFAELIRDSAKGTSASQMAEKIIAASNRMQKIIVQLRGFARGANDFKSIVLDIRGPIENAQTIMRKELDAAHIVIKTVFDHENRLIDGDPTHLESIFQNLFSNSRDAFHSVEDGRTRTITIRSKLTSDAMQIVYTDNAGGIPDHHLKRIFDPFYTTKAAGKGTGLGMFITQDVIKKHNGKITVDSVEGKGTTFTIMLPLSKGQIEEPSVVAPAKAQIKLPARFNGRRAAILLIDDEPDLVELLIAMLSEDFDIQGTTDPNVAKDYLNNTHFDLVITDMKMPISGADFITYIRDSLKLQMPIILITGHVHSQAALDPSIQHEVEFVLQKPLPSKDELVEQVLKCLQ